MSTTQIKGLPNNINSRIVIKSLFIVVIVKANTIQKAITVFIIKGNF